MGVRTRGLDIIGTTGARGGIIVAYANWFTRRPDRLPRFAKVFLCSDPTARRSRKQHGHVHQAAVLGRVEKSSQ
jgi:hypothetical protein